MQSAVIVSVIIPIYNGAQYIRQAIDSVLAQTYRNYELIAVDDGSTDNSVELLQSYGDAITLVREGRGGSPAIARNKGFRHAKGVYLAFLDQDDLWFPAKLARQVAYLEVNPDVGIVHSSAEIHESGQVAFIDYYAQAKNVVREGGIRDLFLKNFIINPSTSLLRRDVYEKAGGYDERLFGTDDYHLWLKMVQFARIGFVGDVLTVYRTHTDNASADTMKMLEHEYLALSYFVTETLGLERYVARREIATRMSTLCLDLAYRCKRAGRMKDARQWLRESLSYKPFDLIVYSKYLKYQVLEAVR